MQSSAIFFSSEFVILPPLSKYELLLTESTLSFIVICSGILMTRGVQIFAEKDKVKEDKSGLHEFFKIFAFSGFVILAIETYFNLFHPDTFIRKFMTYFGDIFYVAIVVIATLVLYDYKKEYSGSLFGKIISIFIYTVIFVIALDSDNTVSIFAKTFVISASKSSITLPILILSNTFIGSFLFIPSVIV